MYMCYCLADYQLVKVGLCYHVIVSISNICSIDDFVKLGMNIVISRVVLFNFMSSVIPTRQHVTFGSWSNASTTASI
jgi:hypothetical protein